MTIPAAARPPRRPQRLLTVLVALIGLLVGLAGTASASTIPKPGSSPGSTLDSVLETRVGVAATPVGLFVVHGRSVSAVHVREKCPWFDGFTLVSCVATKAVGGIADDLAVAERHLARLPGDATKWGPNRMMLDRIGEAQSSGRALTVAEKNFLAHETFEAKLVDAGMRQDAAHVLAGQKHPAFANCDPAVIKADPQEFASGWKKYWGIP